MKDKEKKKKRKRNHKSNSNIYGYKNNNDKTNILACSRSWDFSKESQLLFLSILVCKHSL